MLKVQNLHVSYGAVRALRGIDLHVEAGEIVTLVGANGAGKSTLLNSVCGVCSVTQGAIHYEGGRIDNRPPHLIARSGISQSPEGRRVFPRMTVEENLVLGGQFASNETIRERLEDQFDLFPRLKDRRFQRAGTLSGGEQQMLAIARALMSEPKLLLLDEPSLGLAPLVSRGIFEAIVQINRNRGTAVLLVEQNAYQALRIAHRGYVMVNGRVELEGPASEVLRNPAVRSAYLEGATGT